MTRAPADVGAPVAEIDTPALVVDLDAYERNLDRMAKAVAGTSARLRPHAKTHKCAVVALHQIARGAVGVCCQKVGEAEAMVYGGVQDVLVSNEIVGPRKLARLCGLARQARVATCVDDPAHIDPLDLAARAAGIRLAILVEIDMGRCGVAAGAPAVELARQVASRKGLRFAGLQAYHGSAQHIVDAEERRATIGAAIARVGQTVEDLRAAGLPAETVSGAGTGTFEHEAASGVYTEIQAGSYPFMDVDYRRVAGAPQQFEHSLFVLATVMSRSQPERAVVDAGLKALSVDAGMPRVHGREDLEFARASDEHGRLVVRDPARGPRVGDRLWLIPGHCDPTINLYDWYVAVRGGLERGRVEALWPIAARGAVL